MQRVGPMRRSDIPHSAVDFHVSNIVEELLQHEPVQAAAQDAAKLSGVSPPQVHL